MQVSIVPVPSIVQPAGGTGPGPASAGPPNASDSAPAATVPRNAFRKRRGIGRPATPAAAIPPGPAHAFVIEIPTAPKYNPRVLILNRIARVHPDRLPQKRASHQNRTKGAAMRQHLRKI